MTKAKKTILWSTIVCLCVFAVAGTAIGVSYSMYSNSNSGSGLINIPSWGFDLTSGEDASFQTETSAKLAPDQSVYTEGNTNRSNLSDPIGVAKITNNGDVTGDLQINAGIKESDPYVKNSKYESNEQFENEFLNHFEVYTYYSSYLDSTYDDDFNSTLVRVDSNTYITLYPEAESDNTSTFNSVYIYVRVNWISDIDNNNGDAFDTWVGKYISKINLSVGFSATQHGAFTPTSETAKLGAKINSYTCYYFDGTIDSGHLGVTTNYQEAVDLTITEFEEGKYTLGFYSVEPTRYYDDSGLTYIGYSGSGTSLTLTSDPYTWYYDDNYDVFYTYDNNSSQRFIGNQDGQEYFACYSYSNITNNSYHTSSSFESEPELEEAPEGPSEDDQTYKLGVLDGDTYKYFDGVISSHHMETTNSYDDAVDVYITKTGEDDYTCTLSFYNNDTLEYIASSENSSNTAYMEISTTPYTWTWDDTTGYFYTSSFNNRFIGHQSGNDYFACYANSNVTASNYNLVTPYTSDPDLVAPTSIVVNADNDKTEIEAGQTLQLYATISPSTGVNQHISWSSSDDNVATINESGLVTGISAGDVIIYATSVVDDSIKGQYELTVTAPKQAVYKESETIVASEIYSSVESGDNRTITDDVIYCDLVTITFGQNGGSTAPHYYGNGSDFRIYSKNQIIFTPVDDSVAEISKIELTYSGSYYGNDTATFTDGTGATAGTIDNPKSSGGVITIDVTGSGVLTYCNDYSSNSGGTQLRCTQITIYYEEPNDTVPSSITISGDQEVEEGSSIQLTASVSPEEANHKVTWSSLDETIASVSQSGLVTGVGAGETTIRATSILSDEVYGEYEVTVNAKALGETPEGLIGTYDFSNAGRTSNNSSVATTAVDTFFTTENVYIGENVTTNPYNECTAAEKVGLGADGSSSGGLLTSNNCLKLGTSSAAGSVTLTFKDVSISQIVLYATSWNASNTPVTLSVNDEVSMSITEPGSSLSSVDEITPTTFTLSNATDTITIASSKPSGGDYRAVIYMMEIYYYNS